MSKQLRKYQTDGVDAVSKKVGEGLRKILFQLATGGGKTVTFAALTNRYIAKNNRRVLVLVDRIELLKQARVAFYEWYEIIAEPVTAKLKSAPTSPVMVAMVETAFNRLGKNPKYFGDVGLLIVDECHIGSFKKMYEQFPETIIVGFTATPISSSKKDPLKNYFEDIVCGIDIPELIESGSLTPNRTYHVKNIKRSDIKVSKGEFDERAMGDMFSAKKHVNNTVDGYKKLADGSKALVFNCNVAHSLVTNEAFINAGYNSRHLDGKMTQQRVETIKWFENTPGAILNNVGILTKGFDSPSTLTVVVNLATLSLSKWLQMTGRGSRPYPNKDYFTIIDMGGNALTHGDWCDARNWNDIFHNPGKPSKGGGVAPIKECCECQALIASSSPACKFCGADNSKVQVYDDAIVEFELLTASRPLECKVAVMVETNKDRNAYYTVHEIKDRVITQAKYSWGMKKLTDQMAYKLLDVFQEKVKEWCEVREKRYDSWHKETTSTWFFTALEKQFGYKQVELSIAI